MCKNSQQQQGHISRIPLFSVFFHLFEIQFKEEREKILKVVLADEADKSDNDPESHDFLDEDALKRLRKEGGKVSFEEMGKIIGQRWKNIEPNRLTKFSELAAEDTERYKKEMTEYNGRQEQKMRNEALKPPVSSFTRGDKSGMASMMDPSRAGYGDAMASFGAQMGGYYGGMDFSAYGMGMGGMYAPYGYPASMGGGADGMGGSGSGMAGRMDSSQYAQGGGGMYGMMGGGYQGQMMGYG